MEAFEKAGMWPMNEKALMSDPSHKSFEDVETILSVEELEKLYGERKKRARARMLGEGVETTANGFVNTVNGSVSTNENAMKQVSVKYQIDRSHRACKASEAAE